MITTLPNYLIENTNSIITIDGISLASYRVAHNELSAEVFISTSLVNFIIEGTKEIVSADHRTTVNAGEFYFIRKGNYIMSSILPSAEGSFSAILIFLNDTVVREFISENRSLFTGIQNPPVRSLYQRRSTEALQAAAQSLLPYFNSKSTLQSSIIRYKIFELLLNIIDTDESGEFRRQLILIGDKSGDDLEDYMMQNFHLPLTVDQFADNTFRSLSKFKKDFKERFNQTPKNWINERRLEKANTLLSDKKLSVTEICFLCGFESLSYFIQLFRERYGITPKQLQNQN